MGRAPCCSKVGLHRGPWTPREDELLVQYIQSHGEGNWRNLPKNAGLLRCGKSCRLRWVNYLRPDIKRGNIGPEEEDLIIRLHALLGNRWSLIAGRLPGRTDNEIKNYWNGHLSKKLTVQHDSIEEGSSKPKSRRNKNGGRSTKKKEEKRKTKTETEVAEARTQIHAPKPTRIISIARMETSEGSDSKMGSSSSEDNDFDINWSSVDQGSFFTEKDACTSYVLDCDLFLEADNMFEGLYQDYSQLLNFEEDQLEMFPCDERW